MTTAASTTHPLSDDEMRLARESRRKLKHLAGSGRPLTVRSPRPGEETDIELPARTLAYLIVILDAMASGSAVTITPRQAELTTQQAADLLNVSRPFLIRLVENGTIPCRMVGTHRRLRLEDVVAYKEATDAQRRKVLDELAAEAQELDMGY